STRGSTFGDESTGAGSVESPGVGASAIVPSAAGDVTSTGSVASAPASGSASSAVGDATLWTSAASSGSPIGVSPSVVASLAAPSAAESGTSVFRVRRVIQMLMCGRPGVGLELGRRDIFACARYSATPTVASAGGTGTRDAPRTLRTRSPFGHFLYV